MPCEAKDASARSFQLADPFQVYVRTSGEPRPVQAGTCCSLEAHLTDESKSCRLWRRHLQVSEACEAGSGYRCLDCITPCLQRHKHARLTAQPNTIAPAPFSTSSSAADRMVLDTSDSCSPIAVYPVPLMPATLLSAIPVVRKWVTNRGSQSEKQVTEEMERQ